MAISRTLIYTTEEGSPALKPTWFDNAGPAGTESLFHDLFEHFPNQPDPVAGELMAFGAFAVMRFDDTPVAREGMGGSIGSLLQDMMWENLPVPGMCRTRRLTGDYEYAERAFEGAAEHGIQVALEEVQSIDDSFPERGEYWRQVLLGLKETLMGWMRRGLRKALKRYGSFAAQNLAPSLIPQLKQLIGRLLESDVLVEGATVRVSVDLGRLLLRVFVDGRDLDTLFA